MVNWQDPVEMAKENSIFTKVIFTCFGVYIWELFLTWDFEWSLITRKRKFKWPLIFFFLCRYSILWALIGLLISFSLVNEVNCQALYIFNSFTGQMAILNASTSLMIRTIALWERRLIVTIPLVALSCAHWIVLWRGMFVIDAHWDPAISACAVSRIDTAFLEATFFFTMGFDAIILSATTTALYRHGSSQSGLWNLLFRDGLVYFLVTASCNSVPVVLNVLQLNNVMNIIATVPAATIAAIAACRLVIRLQEFAKADSYIHSSQGTPDTRFALGRNVATPRAARFNGASRPEIHVTTDHHITVHDFSPTTASSALRTPYDSSLKSPYDETRSKFDIESKGDQIYALENIDEKDSEIHGASLV